MRIFILEDSNFVELPVGSKISMLNFQCQVCISVRTATRGTQLVLQLRMITNTTKSTLSNTAS